MLDRWAREWTDAEQAALALDDRSDAGLALGVDGVGFQIAEAAAALHDGRPALEGALAGELAATVRDPILITQHGKPAAYLVDVATYEEMNRRISVLEGIALGEQAIREGRKVSQKEAKRRLAKWLN